MFTGISGSNTLRSASSTFSSNVRVSALAFMVGSPVPGGNGGFFSSFDEVAGVSGVEGEFVIVLFRRHRLARVLQCGLHRMPRKRGALDANGKLRDAFEHGQLAEGV